jgi:glycine/D-amino acid oxidase-like deaminating enzyme
MNRPAIAVIGAGIIGSLVAREVVSREPVADVTLIERDSVGAGASRYSAGLHFPRGSSESVRQMSEYSGEYYSNLLSRDPSLPIYPLPMRVIAAPESLSRLREQYLKRANLAPAADLGYLGVELGDMTAWTGQGCQYANVFGLVQRIVQDLRPRIVLREGVAVTGLTSTSEKVQVRLSTGAEMSFDCAVLAPGPWAAAEWWRELTDPLGIRVKRVIAIHIEQTPREGDPCIVFEEEDAFLLPVIHRGHWLFSYTCREWDTSPDNPSAGLSARHIEQAREVLRPYAPRLAERCASGRVFCDAYSIDRRPIVRTLDEPGRILFAGAANGSGYRLGPAIAAATADLLNLPSN